MIQQDYILRMVKQLSAFLVKVLLDKKAGKQDDALQTMESAFKDLLGFNSNLFDSISVDSILKLLEAGNDPKAMGVKCLAAARLLQEKAEILRLSHPNDEKAFHCDQDALAMLLEGLHRSGDAGFDKSDFLSGMDTILSRLKENIPGKTRKALFRFYFAAGQFDKAEDELFRLKEHDYPDIKALGIDFFRQLGEMDDTQLMAGNFCRDEIDEGLRDFLNRS